MKNLSVGYQKNYHYDTEIEEAVLGACLLESDAYPRISSILQKDHFYHNENQVLYEVLSEMWGNGEVIDILTVNYYIHQNKLSDVFDNHHNPAYYLTRITMSVVSSAHMERHSFILRQLHMERQFLAIQNEAGSGDGDTLDRAIRIKEQIEQALSVRGTDDWVDMSQMMLSLTKHMESVKDREILGVSSGFPSLDKITYGFQPGDLIVIGARPSVGKSAFVGGVAIGAAESGKLVGIISLEMTKEQLAARFASLYSDVEFFRIYRNLLRSAQQEEHLATTMAKAATLPIFTSEKTQVTPSDIRSKIYKLKKRHGKIDLIIIDYLQLIESETTKGNETREREVSKISRSLKLMAMDLRVPIVLLCQLNRESEHTSNKKPRMANLRESGAIEQDADVVILLHRDWKAGITTDEHGNSTELQADLLVEKNRNGETMPIKIAFDPEKIKFYEPQEDIYGGYKSDNNNTWTEQPFG